jgi:TP901 family phage tail tape measure protein
MEATFNDASIKLERMNSAIRGVTATTLAWGAAVAIPLANIYKAGAGLEDQLIRSFNKLDEIVPLGSARFEELRNQIAATTKGTEVFQKAAAAGFNAMAGAGFDAQKSIGALPIMYSTARFAQMELGDVSVRAVDVMKMFNLETKDANQNTKNLVKTMNMLALADANSTTSMQQLFEAIQNGGAKASEFGTDIATFLAMVTNMNSLKSFEAGTGAKQIFNRLIPTEKTTRAVFDALGIRVADKGGKLLDPLTVLQNLTDKLETKTEYERAQALKLIFGLEGNAPAIMMKEMRMLPGKIVADREKLRQGGDILGRFDTQYFASAQGKWDIFLKNLDDRRQELFKPLRQPAMDAMDKITKWMTDNQDRMIVVMNKLVDKIPTIADSLMTIAENLPMLIKAVIALKAAELTAKLGRGGLGIFNWLFGTPTGAGAAGAAGGAAVSKATTMARFAVANPGAMALASVPLAMAVWNATPGKMKEDSLNAAYFKANPKANPRYDLGSGFGRSISEAFGLATYESIANKTRVVSGVDNTNMGKSIGIKIFSTIPNIQAEVVSPGFSPSSLTLPNSGAF